jgi:hypothetical protein
MGVRGYMMGYFGMNYALSRMKTIGGMQVRQLFAKDLILKQKIEGMISALQKQKQSLI